MTFLFVVLRNICSELLSDASFAPLMQTTVRQVTNKYKTGTVFVSTSIRQHSTANLFSMKRDLETLSPPMQFTTFFEQPGSSLGRG